MIDQTQLIKKYKHERKNISLIAKELKVNPVTIHRAINKYGIERNSLKKTLIDKKILVENYFTLLKSVAQIAKELKTSHKFISLCFEYYGLKQRSKSDTAKIRNKRLFSGYVHRKKSQGYVFIKMPSHPRSNKYGYVQEHIVIMESVIGRPLKNKEVVHHINKNKEDNRPENLMLFRSHSEHITFHNLNGHHTRRHQ